MSDFLTNLAARALAPPTLRPRTPSRFEPASLAEAPEPWEEEGQPQRSRDPRSASAPGAHAATPEDPADPAPERTPHDAVLRERTREVVHERTRSVAEHHQVTREVLLTPSPETTPTRRPLPAIAQDQRSGRSERTPAERATETRGEIRDRERTLPAFTPAARATARIHREPRPASPAIARVNRDSSPAAPEPVIHVSIGRVEVRAVTPSAAPRSGRRNAAMTIDDYVARKNAKERR